MTGYTVHTGASQKFVSGWDRVFGKATKKTAAAAGSQKKPAATKATAKKKSKGK